MDNTLIALGADKPNQFVETQFNLVSADYFQTMSLPIMRGRSFSEDEVKAKAQVVVVSEEIARRYWPGATQWASTSASQSVRRIAMLTNQQRIESISNGR
jgi:hypothetical protein